MTSDYTNSLMKALENISLHQGALSKALESDDRTIAIIGVAFMDEVLRQTIRPELKLKNGVETWLNRRSTSELISLALATTEFDDAFAKLAKALVGVRNGFAHSLSIHGFDHPGLEEQFQSLDAALRGLGDRYSHLCGFPRRDRFRTSLQRLVSALDMGPEDDDPG